MNICTFLSVLARVCGPVTGRRLALLFSLPFALPFCTTRLVPCRVFPSHLHCIQTTRVVAVWLTRHLHWIQRELSSRRVRRGLFCLLLVCLGSRSARAGCDALGYTCDSSKIIVPSGRTVFIGEHPADVPVSAGVNVVVAPGQKIQMSPTLFVRTDPEYCPYDLVLQQYENYCTIVSTFV